MEENVSSLFSLGIDAENKAHLAETARWARFLSVVSMIMILLALLFCIVLTVFMGQVSSPTLDNTGFPMTSYATGMRYGGLAMVVVMLGISFVPFVFLLRFANKLRTAIRSDDQAAMTISFLNLKRFFRYIGILTLIVIIIYAFMFILVIVSGSFMR